MIESGKEFASLRSRQAALHERIRARAVELGFDAGRVAPIYDGVVDADGYLATNPRVMWILKEPYDDWDEDGAPCGGGWTMFKDFGGGADLAKAVNRTAALRNVAYASYALQHGVSAYADLPWISECPEVAESLLRTAFVNVSKMPALPSTDESRLGHRYEDWKDILFDQIELYDPTVIVFGNTFHRFAPDMGLSPAEPVKKIRVGGSSVDVHEWRGKRLLWAPHPAAHIPPAEWVDSVLVAVRNP